MYISTYQCIRGFSFSDYGENCKTVNWLVTSPLYLDRTRRTEREKCLKGALGVMGRSKTSSEHPRLRLRDDLRPVRAVKKRNISRMTLFYKEKASQFWENSSNIFLSNQMHQCNLILSTCVDFPNYSLGHAREHGRHCFYWRVVYITKNRTKGHKYHSLVPSPFHKLF